MVIPAQIVHDLAHSIWFSSVLTDVRCVDFLYVLAVLFDSQINHISSIVLYLALSNWCTYMCKKLLKE